MTPDPESSPPPIENAPPPEPVERYPFWGYEDVVILTLLAVLLLIGVSTLFFLLPWRPSARAAGPIAAQFLFYALWFMALWALIKTRYGRPFWRSLAWLEPRRGLIRSAVLGIEVALVSILMGVVLRPPEIKTPLDQLLQDPVSIALVGVFAITLGPLCEELAFRGLLLPLLARTFGAAAGILLTAAPFALLHGSEYAWNWQRLVIIFFAGAMFGFQRYRTGSTAAATVMHSAYNLVFFAGLVAQRAGLIH